METKNLLTTREACNYLGISRAGLYTRLDSSSPYHDPAFPRPIKLGRRNNSFRRSELEAWIASRT
ncbi:helix-turn-helix transcriptional regulator [Methylomonas rhizoryzae]|uniref:helix-turn-helix transcriptional regulator n=1 Tax=Methylomonas rhizoryzae TaxID=2608981 RepID=UPI001231ED8B